jgi:hypothetical protein
MDSFENKVYRTSIFDADYKRFAKKYVSVPSEIQQLEEMLVKQPDIGVPLGGNVYKIRMACESKGKGKRGGFRIITYLVDEQIDRTDIYLIMMYDKSEEGSIKTSQLRNIIGKIFH